MPITVPNDPQLAGAEVFLQAVLLDFNASTVDFSNVRMERVQR